MEIKKFEAYNRTSKYEELSDKDLIFVENILIKFLEKWKLEDRSGKEILSKEKIYSIVLYPHFINLYLKIKNFNNTLEKDDFCEELTNAMNRVEKYGYIVDTAYFCKYIGFTYVFHYSIKKPKNRDIKESSNFSDMYWKDASVGDVLP
jgi:hypothetical protein